MTPTLASPLAELYEEDETAWLDVMAELVLRRDFSALDLKNLAEFLSDMARRDRREVKSRLTLLLAHWLKWDYQPEKRSGSWRATIATQRSELCDLAESGVLRHHAESILAEAYANAVEQSALETNLPDSSFPTDCPWSLDRLLNAIPDES